MTEDNHRLAGAEPSEQRQDSGDISETLRDEDNDREKEPVSALNLYEFPLRSPRENKKCKLVLRTETQFS